MFSFFDFFLKKNSKIIQFHFFLFFEFQLFSLHISYVYWIEIRVLVVFYKLTSTAPGRIIISMDLLKMRLPRDSHVTASAWWELGNGLVRLKRDRRLRSLLVDFFVEKLIFHNFCWPLTLFEVKCPKGVHHVNQRGRLPQKVCLVFWKAM